MCPRAKGQRRSQISLNTESLERGGLVDSLFASTVTRKGVRQSDIGLRESPGCKNGANIERNLVLLHWQLDKSSPVQLPRGPAAHTTEHTY